MEANVVEPLSKSSRLQTEFVVEAGPLPEQTQVIQKALDACSAEGGGRVVLRPGVHEIGTLFLRSDVTLHLEKDAILSGSTDIADYARKSGEPGARIMHGVATALIFAEDAQNFAITGEGTIDGNGRSFWKKAENVPDWVEGKKVFGTWIPGFVCASKERTRALVMLVNCRKVRMEDIRIQNSPSWTVHLLACTDVTMRGVAVRGAVDGSNTDGIDLDACSNVLVEDCDVQTGDDALALKNTNGWGLKRASRNITVRRCRLCSTTHGFTIGTETQDDFEDITVVDTRIEKSGDHRTLTGIGLSIVDGAAIRRLRISNVTVADAIAPIQIRLANTGRGQATPTPGVLEDITLENISIERAYGNSLIMGLPGHPLRRIALCNIKVDFIGLADLALVPAVVPQQGHEFPDSFIWRFLPAYGFFCRDIDGLELSDISFTAPVEETRTEIQFKDVNDLTCRDIRVVRP